MTMPFNRTINLWQAKAANETVDYVGHEQAFPVQLFGQIRLSVEVTAFTGSLSFEWSADGSNWHTLPYVEGHSDTKLTLGVVDAQPSFVLETGGRIFIVPGGPLPWFRIVMTRTAGSITAVLQGFEHDNGYVGSR